MAIRVLALTAMGAAAFGPAVHAQDMTTYTFGGTTIWVGGGVQFLSLPDIRFTEQNGRRQKNSESDWLDFGGAAGGGIETALGMWGSSRVTGSVKGFFANVETDDSKRCSGSCAFFDPNSGLPFTGGTLNTKTDRDADYWGAQAELKFGRAEPVHVKPNLYRNDYFIVGADVRGIDQDNTLRSSTGTAFSYKESLDTTYVGGYIGLGGEYSLGFLTGGGLYDRLGLRTFIAGRAGLYSADTDYDGRFASGSFGSKISQSNDELAFIGTVSLETRKQIGMRTSLSLWTDYEYISSVPKMHYADDDGRPTRIDDEGVFASRTMLRLNIGFGAAQLYDEPLK
ncbi:MAG: hypothetical protein ACREC3_15855 [Methyloceanibacter sp.]